MSIYLKLGRRYMEMLQWFSAVYNSFDHFSNSVFLLFTVHVRVSFASYQLDGCSSSLTGVISALYDNAMSLLAPAPLGHGSSNV